MHRTRSNRPAPSKLTRAEAQGTAKRRRQEVAAALAELAQLEPVIASAADPEQLQTLRRSVARLRRRLRKQRGRLAAAGRLQAAELEVRVAWKLGRWLAEHVGRGGDHRSPRRAGSMLRRLKISHYQSSTWQRMACQSAEVLEALAHRARAERRELTQAAVLRGTRPIGAGVRAPQPVPPTAAGPAAVGGGGALADWLELRNHLRQLGRLLAPVCGGRPAELRPAECRQIARLLGELAQLWNRLEGDRSNCTSAV